MTVKEAIEEIKNASDREIAYGDIERRFDDVMKRVEAFKMAISALEKKEGKKQISVETNIYDTEEIHHNCTVQVLRNKRDVWSVSTKPYSGAHFATYPEELILPCILAGSKEGDTVLDPFNGAATTGVVCAKNGREYIGIELNPEYVKISEDRIASVNRGIEEQSRQVALW